MPLEKIFSFKQNILTQFIEILTVSIMLINTMDYLKIPYQLAAIIGYLMEVKQ